MTQYYIPKEHVEIIKRTISNHIWVVPFYTLDIESMAHQERDTSHERDVIKL